MNTGCSGKFELNLNAYVYVHCDKRKRWHVEYLYLNNNCLPKINNKYVNHLPLFLKIIFPDSLALLNGFFVSQSLLIKFLAVCIPFICHSLMTQFL